MAEIADSTRPTKALSFSHRAFLLLLGAISLSCLSVHAQGPLIHKVPFTLRDNAIFKRVTIDFAKSEIDLEDQSHASD